MPEIPIPRKWTQQPQVPVTLRDKYNPAFAYIGSQLIDCAGAGSITPTSGCSRKANAAGTCVAGGSNGASDGVPLPATSAIRFYNSPGTIIAVIRSNDYTATDAPIIYSVRDAGSTSISFFILDDGYSIQRSISLQIGGTQVNSTDNALIDGVPCVVAASWGESGLRIFVNGNLVASNTNTSLPASNSITPWIFNRSNGARGFSGEINGIIGYLKQLPDAELAKLRHPSDVWNRFKRDPQQLFFDVSSSLPTLSSIAASNITTSGARLTVN